MQASHGGLSLVGVDDHCLMLTPLDGIPLRQFAMIALKKISFPRMKIIGLKRSENVEEITEKRVIRRGMSSNDQDTMKLILKQKEIEDEIPHSIGYGRVHLIRANDTYFIKVEVQQEVWTELSFVGSPLLRYHLGFECDKGSIILMGRRDLTLYLIKDRILQERPACVVCQIPKMECEVFTCGHFTCGLCLEKVYRRCKDCPVCKKDWKGLEGGRDKTQKGYIYDEFCRFDDCMEFEVLNLPCRCITCGADKKKCTKCEKDIHVSLPFFY